MFKTAIILFLLTFQSIIYAAVIVEEGIYVSDEDRQFLEVIKQYPELTIDHLTSQGYELYGPKGLIEWAQSLKLDFVIIEHSNDWHPTTKGSFSYSSYGYDTYYDEYPSNQENYLKLKELEQLYPEILKLTSIGQSLEGRELWVMKISDNVEIDEVEPEFKYIANMHGNEVTGREMMILLIEDLARGYYQGNSSYQKLINNSEIYIMPTMNPDGFAARRRGNAISADLNRDFPDFIKDPVNEIEGRQPETAAIMEWQTSRHFSLSANLHDGASVVNYPWDSTHDSCPLEDLVIDFSLEYAANIDEMKSLEFPKGITNGAAWYVIHGGMQDWSYFWYGDLQLTVEVSEDKWPPYSAIETFYQHHQKPLIKLAERVHQGAGFKFDQQNISGEVTISKLSGLSGFNQLESYGFDSSEFYKVLPIGLYRFVVTTQNGQEFTFFRLVSKSISTKNGNYKKLKLAL